MSGPRDEGPPWGYLLSIGALAAVAVALLVVPGMLVPQPTTRPEPSATSDPHVLGTGQGTFAIAYEGGALVVRRLTPIAEVLGRAIVPDEMHPAASGAPLRGSGIWVLFCPSGAGGAGSEPLRAMFGSTWPSTNGRYVGPPAAFAIADDGLWLVVLEPVRLDPNARLDVEAGGGGGGVDVRAIEAAPTDGRVQASGCAVSG